jgi:hypothetical protein
MIPLQPILPNVQSLRRDGGRNPQGPEIDHAPEQDAYPIHQFFDVELGETFCRERKRNGSLLWNLAMESKLEVMEPGASNLLYLNRNQKEEESRKNQSTFEDK